MSDCNHNNIAHTYLDQVLSEYKCLNCNQKLLPNWTVKREPLVVEFECFWKENRIIDSVFSTTIYPKETDENRKQIEKMCRPGKRFKVTCTEILEGDNKEDIFEETSKNFCEASKRRGW